MVTHLPQLLQLISWKYVYHNFLYHINFPLLYNSSYSFPNLLSFKAIMRRLKKLRFQQLLLISPSQSTRREREKNQHLYQQTSFMYSNVSQTFYSIHTVICEIHTYFCKVHHSHPYIINIIHIYISLYCT